MPTKPRVLYQHQLNKRRIPRKRRVLLRPELTVAQILGWADAFHRRAGRWPTADSGRIAGPLRETWCGVDMALRVGCRGLPGGSSLARLLAAQRGYRNPMDLIPLDEEQILQWADAHHRRTGRWPNRDSGPIAGTHGETWGAVEANLRVGLRGLPGGSSLAQLLAERRGIRNLKDLPMLTVARVLAWADAHHRRTGTWPNHLSGPIPDAPGETWSAVHQALTRGRRGLPKGSSLARLLAEHRRVRNKAALPPLTPSKILVWAKAHYQRAGMWPTSESGPIPEAPGETWCAVNMALRAGVRGLPGGSSLSRLLKPQRPRPLA